MPSHPTSPHRVRVTRSRRNALPAKTRPVVSDLDEQTPLGDVYLGALMRAQLRLSLLVIALGIVAIGGFPVLLLSVPSTRNLAVFGLPFPWLVLGVVAYPALWVISRWYARQAERLESEFTDMVDPS